MCVGWVNRWWTWMKYWLAVLFYFKICTIVFQFVIKKLKVIMLPNTFFFLERLVNLLCVLSIPNSTNFHLLTSRVSGSPLMWPYMTFSSGKCFWFISLIMSFLYFLCFPIIKLLLHMLGLLYKFLFYVLLLFFDVFILPYWIFLQFDLLTLLLIF